MSSATTCVFLCIEVSGEDKGREMSLLFEGSLMEMEVLLLAPDWFRYGDWLDTSA